MSVQPGIPTLSRSPETHQPRRVGLFMGVLALTTALALFLYFGLKSSGLSDQDQIMAMLDDFRSAVATQSVDGVFAHLSPQFQVEGLNRRQARLELINFFRQHPMTEVVFRSPQIAIDGDAADLGVYAEVTGASSAAGSPGKLYASTIQIHLVRQETRRFFIFPHQVWKVTGVQAPDLEKVEGV